MKYSLVRFMDFFGNESLVIVNRQFSWVFSLTFATSSSVMLGRSLRSSSRTLVRPCLNLMHDWRTPPFADKFQSVHVFFPQKNLLTDCVSQLSGNDMNLTMAQLGADWADKHSDNKMAALALAIAVASQT